MKILFSMRHPGALRNYASTLCELAARGHQIHLAFMMRDKLRDARLLNELTAAYPGITADQVGKKAPWRFWLGLARSLRYGADFLRYGTPEFAGAQALRKRAASRVPAPVRTVLRLPFRRGPRGSRRAARVFDAIERAIPADRWIVRRVAAARPDVVLVTPLVDLGSDQVEYIKAARALGLRSGLCVHSWDNLTNKGIIRVVPDRVFVWNETQKRESVTMHGVSPAQVVVTGAPVYDQWFERRPSTTRGEFCRKVGLPADRPFFRYLCSSKFIAANESAFVEKWIRAIRSAPDPRVRAAGILVRPHPRNLRPWRAFDVSGFEHVVVWPRDGANPVDTISKNDYYDSMYHAAAAVGINTSAQIEAGIVGRPVYSIRTREYAATQEGTLHFHYLLQENGGLLHMADSLEGHARALAGAVERTEDDARRLRNFVQGFVRPHGLDVPATPLLADAIEDLGRQPTPAPERTPARLIPIRLALYPVTAGLEFVRYVAALAGRRERQLRPFSVGEFLRMRLDALAASVFRWKPARRFARRYIVPHVISPVPHVGRPAEPRTTEPRAATPDERREETAIEA